MDPPRAIYPTCVFKVNISCCKACVVNLKKLLFKIDGVHEVDIDADKRLVKVTGKADPAIILDKIQEKKKKAEILSYEDPTVNTQTEDSKKKQDKKNGNNLKAKEKYCFCPDEPEPHECEDYVPPKEFQDDVCRDPYCKLHHKKTIIHGNNYVPRVRVQPPPRRFPPLPPPPPVPHYPPVPHNPHYYREDLPVECDHCCSRRLPLPPPLLPPHYGYRRARHGGYSGY
ncbi:heavy metal-associated isoprenylated plant protein 42-like [Actinidia eriantha]|uniref:heavy metal-associated isoprenylated plant protein 42-like n=1 Tax=Actinidia eriantha TaxID=165200 RepID=UPI0025869604|nr:heavy metal-associated isoprenylated plant protein 42-like [Actinidia eriantha]